MLHPHTELRFINQVVGFGVVATQFIPKGTITWVLHQFDQIFTPEKVKSMPLNDREIIYKYAYPNNEGNYILCWDHARYINHSFRSNCVSTAYEFELAVRDIYPGEELTDDYGYLNIESPFDCLSEEGTERRQVMPDDLFYGQNGLPLFHKYHFLDSRKHIYERTPVMMIDSDAYATNPTATKAQIDFVRSLAIAYHQHKCNLSISRSAYV